MPIPDETRDRWDSRAEPDSGKGAIYWHILFRDNPAVRATAKEAQARLASFRDLHMTPGEWLHATALVAGTTDDISDEDLDLMLAEARQRLSGVQPIERDNFQGPLSPGGDHAGVHARRCPRSHPRRCAAGHAYGNGANRRYYRACRAMGSPYDHLLQHGQTAHGPHRRRAGARSAAMRHQCESRQPGYSVGTRAAVELAAGGDGQPGYCVTTSRIVFAQAMSSGQFELPDLETNVPLPWIVVISARSRSTCIARRTVP